MFECDVIKPKAARKKPTFAYVFNFVDFLCVFHFSLFRLRLHVNIDVKSVINTIIEWFDKTSSWMRMFDTSFSKLYERMLSANDYQLIILPSDSFTLNIRLRAIETAN